MFCNKGVLRNLAKFTGKRLCQRLFFNKVAGLRTATLLLKSLWNRCFPVNFVKFLRTPFFTEHLRWLLPMDIREAGHCKVIRSIQPRFSFEKKKNPKQSSGSVWKKSFLKMSLNSQENFCTRVCNVINKKTPTQVFSLNFAKFLRTLIL